MTKKNMIKKSDNEIGRFWNRKKKHYQLSCHVRGPVEIFDLGGLDETNGGVSLYVFFFESLNSTNILHDTYHERDENYRFPRKLHK